MTSFSSAKSGTTQPSGSSSICRKPFFATAVLIALFAGHSLASLAAAESLSIPAECAQAEGSNGPERCACNKLSGGTYYPQFRTYRIRQGAVMQVDACMTKYFPNIR